jgi:hypothetical protein
LGFSWFWDDFSGNFPIYTSITWFYFGVPCCAERFCEKHRKCINFFRNFRILEIPGKIFPGNFRAVFPTVFLFPEFQISGIGPNFFWNLHVVRTR